VPIFKLPSSWWSPEIGLHLLRRAHIKDLHAFARPLCRQFDDARPPRRPFDADDKFGKLKFTIPKFTGDDGADAYFSWAIKVDKIFRMHNYSEEKKVAMASLEFEGYANIWWEQVVAKREEDLMEPIDTWEDMKLEMQIRFALDHNANWNLLCYKTINKARVST
jgi:hypothetical protein